MSGIRLSKLIQGGMDVNVKNVTEDANSHYAPNAVWQLATQYAILQELKTLNANINILNGRYRTMLNDVKRIDRRLAIGKKLPKGRVKGS